MFKKYKTGRKNRTNYIYYSAAGERVTLTPDNVDAAYIAALHGMDDEEVNQNRREMDKHVSVHIVRDGEEYTLEIPDERIDVEGEALALCGEFDIQNDKLLKAVRKLKPSERDVVKRLWFDGLKRKELAGELGVSYDAMRKRTRRIMEKLKKSMGDER
jgi:RNA polymerase sigma factor (sigma-70 family)